MTLSEFIKQYREQHNMSIRSFASLTGISPQQISNIEKGLGNDKKPMTSTMKTYSKIAKAIGMEENDFLNMLSDNVRVNPMFDDDPDALLDEVNYLYASPGALAVIRACMGLTEEQLQLVAQIAGEMKRQPLVALKPEAKRNSGLIVSA